MRRVVLDGRLATLDAVYDCLARELAFPSHFGRNLDALWDVLSTDIPGPIEIIWRDHAEARLRLGPRFDELVALFRDLEVERPDVRLRLE